MIFLTGDCHGEYEKFLPERFPEQKNLTKNDYVIVTGDFGYWEDKPYEHEAHEFVRSRPFTTLFVDGNHCNFDRLNALPVTEDWYGGKVQFLNDSIIHLMRGQVYELEGSSFFTMGGAASHDIDDGIIEYEDTPEFRGKFNYMRHLGNKFRVNHKTWWKEELPSDEEYAEARKNLDAHDWKVDYIVTHCAPTRIQSIAGKNVHKRNELTDFLQEVADKAEFKHWFFGHYHIGRNIQQKYHLLFQRVYPLDMDWTYWG